MSKIVKDGVEFPAIDNDTLIRNDYGEVKAKVKIWSGTTIPDPDLGEEGDLYIKYPVE